MDDRSTIRWGSAGVATAGQVTVEVDEALEGAEGWQLSIDSPAVYLSVRVDETRQLGKFLKFLRGQGECADCEEFSLGLPQHQRLRLVKDDEADGRHFLVFGRGDSTVRVTLSHDLINQVAAALEEVIGQLPDADAGD